MTRSQTLPNRAETKETVRQALKLNRARLQALGVSKIGVFGSFVRGEQRFDSDIDLLVEFIPERKTFDNFMTLSFFLEGLFGRRVELVTREALSPHIGPHILEEVEYVDLAA